MKIIDIGDNRGSFRDRFQTVLSAWLMGSRSCTGLFLKHIDIYLIHDKLTIMSALSAFMPQIIKEQLKYQWSDWSLTGISCLGPIGLVLSVLKKNNYVYPTCMYTLCIISNQVPDQQSDFKTWFKIEWRMILRRVGSGISWGLLIANTKYLYNIYTMLDQRAHWVFCLLHTGRSMLICTTILNVTCTSPLVINGTYIVQHMHDPSWETLTHS